MFTFLQIYNYFYVFLNCSMSKGVEVAHLLVELCEFAVEQAAGQAAEAQVRTQS